MVVVSRWKRVYLGGINVNMLFFRFDHALISMWVCFSIFVYDILEMSIKCYDFCLVVSIMSCGSIRMS